MTLSTGLQFVANVVFLGVALSTFTDAVRTRRSAHRDIALFFGAGALAVAISVSRIHHPLATWLAQVGLLAMPLLLLRVVRDFTAVHPVVTGTALFGFLASVAIVTVVPPPLGAVTLASVVGYIVGVNVYATLRFIGGARAASGARRRRKQAVAVGTLLLAGVFLLAGVRLVVPEYAESLTLLSRILSLGATVAYFLGFAPPHVVRRGWQHPELTQFVHRLSEAPSAPSFVDLIRSLEAGLASGLGAPNALIAIWDDRAQRLYSPSVERKAITAEGWKSTLSYRVFVARQAMFIDDAGAANPENRELYERFGVRTMLIAPLVVRDRTIGVVSLYGDRPALFAEDDLATLVALSVPVATVIENWRLTEERTVAAAFEESLALEREFLAAAAHELRTPLTAILGESQLLQRRLDGGALERAQQNAERVTVQATRMRQLVDDLLSMAREAAGFVGAREPVDLLELARIAAEEFRGVCVTGEPLEVPADRKRLAQVLRNLLDNARKYGPSEAPIDLQVRAVDGMARLEVQDRGVGVPIADQRRIFERFVRGGMTERSGTEGMGLGLYLCRRIVEEHGGRIWVESPPEGGSRFLVALPLTASGADTTVVEEVAALAPRPPGPGPLGEPDGMPQQSTSAPVA